VRVTLVARTRTEYLSSQAAAGSVVGEKSHIGGVRDPSSPVAPTKRITLPILRQATAGGVGVGFPDCEAKRCVEKSGDVWERVRIEFEYKSRNFLDHGHRDEDCDVLVCWEHNWPECPIEVVELRSAIDTLSE
jgi:hypothetical protein